MSHVFIAVLVLGASALAGMFTVGTSVAQPQPDAARGRALFETKQCSRCHIPGGGAGLGPALEELRRPQGTLEFAGRLWNHVPAMWATLSDQRLEWPDIGVDEMADLMAYLGADAARDAIPDPGKGHVVLIRKGCLKCHSLRREGGTVQPDLAARRADYDSPAAWATTMWTHAPKMVKAAAARQVPYPRFSGDEMSNLLGFLRETAAAPSATPRAAPGR